jgi:hypothetical protein
VLNDLHAFNTTSREWRAVITEGPIPSPRFVHDRSMSEFQFLVCKAGGPVGLRRCVGKIFQMLTHNKETLFFDNQTSLKAKTIGITSMGTKHFAA